MHYEEHEAAFREIDLRFAELKRQHEAGIIKAEEFDAQLKEHMVQGSDGRWWAKSRKTGEWHYLDGNSWVQGTPPGYPPNHTTTTTSSGGNTTEVGQQARPTGHPVLPLGGPMKGGTHVTRLEEAFNNPKVVLVVGVVAVALNVLLYFGIFLPRTMVLIEGIRASSTSLPDAPLKSPSETPSEAAPSQQQSPPQESPSEAPQESPSEAPPETPSAQQQSSPPQESPSEAPPETPSAQQQSSPPQESPSEAPPETPSAQQQSPPPQVPQQSPPSAPPGSPSPPTESPPSQHRQYQ